MVVVLLIVLINPKIACESISIECSKRETSYCLVSPPSINFLEGNTFYVINPNYYWQSMGRILVIRPHHHSFIASIDSIFDNFPELDELFIENCLDMVPSMRSTVETLQFVNFRNNFIKNVTEFAFDGARNLEHIVLSSNSIRSIENKAFAGLDRLKSIRLDNNQLGSLKQHTFDGAESLTFINLRNNSITTIADGCFTLKRLEKLILAENQLEILPETIFDGAEHLKKVSFAHNKIKVVNLISIARAAPINTLNFQDNQLGLFEKQSINCTNQTNQHLTHLNLANNKLTNINIFDRLKCLQNIESFNLNSNNFTHFENIHDLKIYFPHLSIIYLVNNKIKCDWLNNTAFDTSLIYTRHNRRKFTIHDIECIP